MKYIAHRGNLNGPNPNKENNPDYITEALKQGYDVEIDVWYEDNRYFLGHDKPQYEVDIGFLKNSSFWCHAKNIDALNMMLNYNINCFWHEDDSVTLTSKGLIWTYPGKLLTKMSICVMPEVIGNEYFNSKPWKECHGVCSDYVKEIKNG